MRRYVFLAICAAASAAPAARFGEILASFPAPRGFCHSLGWDGRYLWSLYDDHTNPITVFCLDPGTGSVVASFGYREAPVHGEPGLAADASYVYTAHGSPDHIHTWTHTGTLLNTFKWPFFDRGLAYDGAYFWCGGMPNYVFKTTLSGSVVASFPVGFHMYDAGYDGDFVICTTNGYLHAVTTTGSVVKTVAVPASLGCDWGGGYLWVGGAYVYKLGWESLIGVRPASFGKIKALWR
ncbi:MAG: hypothetical protein JSU81_11360 [Candidatus Coatesbacteria bacterium]|nr:MAG: hypothetical protein JSU81_11360 [Candidatus Coatesbacteria bacterium]